MVDEAGIEATTPAQKAHPDFSRPSPDFTICYSDSITYRSFPRISFTPFTHVFPSGPPKISHIPQWSSILLTVSSYVVIVAFEVVQISH
jgi:hypothetical protein